MLNVPKSMRRRIFTSVIAVFTVLFVAACCKLQVVAAPPLPEHKLQPGEKARPASPGEMMAYSKAGAAITVPLFCPPGYCPAGCTTCRLPCPNGDECPAVPCAKVTCDESKLCLYEPAGGAACPCFEGEQRAKANCVNSAGLQTCHLATGAPRWTCDPGDCQYREGNQVFGCDVDDAKQVLLCSKELFWEDNERCAGGKICKGGECGCPCHEGAKECVNAKQARKCAGCGWVTEQCPNNVECQGGECRCNEGERRCVSDDDPPTLARGSATVCRNGKWTVDAPCNAPNSCVDGECKPPPCASTCLYPRICVDEECTPPTCPSSQRWCERKGQCVPKCNGPCQLLDKDTLTCRSWCSSPKVCNGGSCCSQAGNQCSSPLIFDPCG